MLRSPQERQNSSHERQPDATLLDSPLFSPTLESTRSPMLFVQPKIEAWATQLRSTGFTDFRWGAGGAIPSQLFEGVKSARESKNPGCPYQKIVEWDGRIFVPSSVDPHSPKIIAQIQSSTELVWDGIPDAVSTRWGKSAPFSRFFHYEDISHTFGPGVGLEFEVRVCSAENFLEAAKYWPKVFSHDELQWHAGLRTLLRAQEASLETITSLKRAQTAEACWRVVAHYALNEWGKDREHLLNFDRASWSRKNVADLAFLEERLPGSTEIPPKAIQHLVDRWLRGTQGEVGLDRPLAIVPDASLSTILASRISVLETPPVPQWVQFAQVLQRYLQTEHNPTQN